MYKGSTKETKAKLPALRFSPWIDGASTLPLLAVLLFAPRSLLHSKRACAPAWGSSSEAVFPPSSSRS